MALHYGLLCGIVVIYHSVVVYVDINECDSANGQCEQICTNTDGSYECSCRTTFFLSNDKHTCTGEYHLLHI